MRPRVDVRIRKINLVQHGNDLEILAERKIQVRNRLRLHTLRCINKKDRAFNRRKRTRDFVGEVDVSRCVDEVENVGAGGWGPGAGIGEVVCVAGSRSLVAGNRSLVAGSRSLVHGPMIFITHPRRRKLNGNPLLAFKLHGI